MYFKHIYDESLAQGSYLIACQQAGKAIVIDAKRDIDTYLEIAEKKNFKITHIAETHIHADYMTGSRELAAVTGGELLLSAEGGEGWLYEFPHRPLRDGDVIKVGNLTLDVLHTPGHTPESISFLLTDHPASDQPTMIFTGDFVFVGDIGRPDLLEEAAGIKGTSRQGAQQMWESLRKFEALPDYVQVWPGHGAGSACGKSLGAVPNSTVGYEKIQNWAFQYKDKQEFTDLLLEGQPEPPKYFAKMKKYNKEERPLLIEVPKYTKLTNDQFLSAYKKGITVIDARSKESFAENHLPNTLNIEGNNSFSTWIGWLVDFDEQFMLIAEEEQIEDLTRKLMRIGYSNVYGYFSEIAALEANRESATLIDYEQMESYVGDEDVQIVDVRGNQEFKLGHIPGADNIFVGTLEDNLDQIASDKKIVLYCQSGGRVAVASSVLKRNGYKNVESYYGGMQEWEKKVTNKEKSLV